ncbi:FAD-dependent thymidylate synthase, partial [Patescibacteria group bacterium]|nr:FAD-dependent thymidylate synthase [Patescibacteria group bacterium]
MSEYPVEDRNILLRHVTNIDDNVYVVYNLPPEVIAVLFAYVSRSPASFRDNLLKLIKEKSLDMNELVDTYSSQGMDYQKARQKAQDFHEKWVVGYGHSSVAEHAVVAFAFENISEIAGKVIQ